MPRRPDGVSPRTEYLRARMTSKGKAMVDQLRAIKGESESNYVRRLVEEDYKRQKAAGKIT